MAALGVSPAVLLQGSNSKGLTFAIPGGQRRCVQDPPVNTWKRNVENYGLRMEGCHYSLCSVVRRGCIYNAALHAFIC
jgi:hypothetical protein